MVQFNKMMVMVPVMLVARKLDSEDAQTVYWLRIAYAVMQSICASLVVYTYWRATQVTAKVVVYVPPPPQPFADQKAKKKYTEIKYCQHVVSTARSLVGSTLFGIVLTCALHYYKGMTMGLAIQTVMAPLNLWESALVRAVFSQDGITPENNVFDEKKIADLTDEDEIVDEQGNAVVLATGPAAVAAASANNAAEKPLEEIMLDTWDQAAKADVKPLMAALNKSNVNTQTSDDRWTSLMIFSGLNCPGNVDGIRKVRDELNADLTITDKDGWNCMHWAAFHNNIAAATELQNETALLAVRDNDGKTPVEIARAEGNNTVADLLEKAANENKKSK